MLFTKEIIKANNHITFTIFSLAILVITLLLVGCDQSTKSATPSNLLIEGNVKPLNVHSQTPNLSWHANVKSQQPYQIQVASSAENLARNKADLWDSSKVLSNKSVNIAYQGAPLNSNTNAFWRVRVWQQGVNEPSAWSTMSTWEMGLLNKADWQAKWLQVATPITAENTPQINQWINLVGTVEKEDGSIASSAIELLHSKPTASLFRHQFSVAKTLKNAKLHSTAGGYYEIFINGQRVKDRIMDPGQTDFDKRILYNTDLVTDFIQSGNNAIAVHLGSGWYDESIAFSGWKNPDNKNANQERKNYSFGQPKFIAQLELTFTDGSQQIVSSNENWLSHPSPVVKEGIFSGELFDANNAVKGWNTVTTDKHQTQTGWQQAQALDTWPTKQLEPQLLPPIRPIKTMLPQRILTPKENVWVFDFGQNFTGIATLHLDQ